MAEFNSTGENDQNKSAGPVVGIVVIIVVLVLGGLYFWGQRIINEQSPEEILNMPDSDLQSLQTINTSDELNTIEEDLNASDVENLDTEIQDIDKELNNL